MCIILAKPASKEVSKETLLECWNSNSDGAGYMYNANGTLRIKKGFFSFDSFYQSYKDSVVGRNRKAVIHFRIKTHGEVNKENCHPFNVNTDVAFAHNGIISNVSTKDNKDFSDTWHFNEKILKPLVTKYPDILENPECQMLLDAFIGASKLAFLTAQDKMFIVNHEAGVFDDGVWYSNRSYLPAKVYNYTSKVQKRQQIAPITLLNNSIKIGDLVELEWQYHGLPKGTEGIVKAINSNYTAMVELYSIYTASTITLAAVPFVCLAPASSSLVEELESYYGNI